MSQNLLDALKTIGIILAFILFVWILIYVLAAPFVSLECVRFSLQTGLETKFDLPSLTCFAKYDNIWLPKDQIFQLLGR